MEAPHPLEVHPKPVSPAYYKKRRYHHGSLPRVAILRGCEMVTLWGPTALTLRGLARDLGVTAPALLYHFGTVAGLRSAVAAAVLEHLTYASHLEPSSRRRPTDDAVATEWIQFAGRHPHLYRLACGEGWRGPGVPRHGQLGGTLAACTPWKLLEVAFRARTRRVGRARGDENRAAYLALSIHGLALARVDGVEDRHVSAARERLMGYVLPP